MFCVDRQRLFDIVLHESSLVWISALLSTFNRFPLKNNVEKTTPASLSLTSTSRSCKSSSAPLWFSHYQKRPKCDACADIGRTQTLLVSEYSFFNLSLKLSNGGDDSYNTSLTMFYPLGLSFSRMTQVRASQIRKVPPDSGLLLSVNHNSSVGRSSFQETPDLVPQSHS